MPGTDLTPWPPPRPDPGRRPRRRRRQKRRSHELVQQSTETLPASLFQDRHLSRTIRNAIRAGRHVTITETIEQFDD